jgi:demethylspheroidene O-methyltransferase
MCAASMTHERILRLLDGAMDAAVIGAALEMNLFHLLLERPLSAGEIAERLNIPLRRCGYMLQMLCRSGLLDEAGHEYVTSNLARREIVDVYSSETWAFLAMEARERARVVRDFAVHVHNPGSVLGNLGLVRRNYIKQMTEDSLRARRFTRMLRELHSQLAEELSGAIDCNGIARLMDLGGGSGVISSTLLRRHPALQQAVVVDIPPVCVAGREIAMENQLQDRLLFHALSDFLADDIPSGFDLIIECDVGVYTEALFRKMHNALNQGGRVVVVDEFPPAKGIAHAAGLYCALERSLNDPEFAAPTADDVHVSLQKAGFSGITERALPARGEINPDTILIEGHK